MFKKLTSNLPFNPSLIGELSFYTRRLHRESGVRRAGMAVLALAIVIQSFAVFSPPQPTLASSSNDLITGGVTSRDQVLQICAANSRDYKTILAYYGITCEDVAKSSVVTLNSTDYSKKLYSMGHVAYGKTGETPVTIPGVAGNIYLRYLWSWDTGASSTYKAFKGTTASGTTFFILFSCGNLTFVGLPKPVAPKPTPQPPKCPFNSAILASDAKCPKPCAFNATIGTTDAKCPKPCTFNSAIATTNPQCPAPCPSNTTIASNDSKCNQPPKCPFNSAILASDAKCPKPCAFNATIAADNVQCPAPCPSNSSISVKDAACKQPEKCPTNSAILKTDAACQACQFNSALAYNDSKCPSPCPYNTAIAADNVQCPAPCPSNGAISDKNPSCKSCTQSRTTNDNVACLSYNKVVANTTQKITNANGTTAKADDVLTYTLTTTNNGSQKVKAYVVNENINDVLDYALVEDLHGGQNNSENIVSWPAVDIAPGKSVTNQITVRIRNPVPQTPTSVTDPGHYDLAMTNVYGNTVTVKLPASVVKTTEVVATKLPNTGPGTSMIMCAMLITFVGYFFARTKLFTKELEIVRADFGSTGGTY